MMSQRFFLALLFYYLFLFFAFKTRWVRCISDGRAHDAHVVCSCMPPSIRLCPCMPCSLQKYMRLFITLVSSTCSCVSTETRGVI